MTQKLKNVYTANKVEPGDVFSIVVTCHITARGYRLYRCMWPPQMDKNQIPKGSPIEDNKIVETLFPIVGWTNTPKDV